MTMFVKDFWEVDDTIVINGKHGKIKQFSSDNKKVWVEHRDNENQPYVRWYDKTELPAFEAPTMPLPAVFEKGQRVRLMRDLPYTTTTVHPIHLYKGDEGIVTDYFGHLGFHRNDGQTSFTREVDGVKLNVLDFCELVADETPSAAQSDSTPLAEAAPVVEEAKPEEKAAEAVAVIVDDLPNDIELLKEIIREQRRKLKNQALSINAMMDASKDEGNLKDKLEQLEDDYKVLENERNALSAERDELAKVNKQQNEMLKNTNEVLDAFRVIGEFLRLDKVVSPKLEAMS
jgi:hypothetical protein